MKNSHSTIECLESRIAPAVIFQVGDFDGDGIAHDVFIKGSSAKERIIILDSSAGTSIGIDADGNGDLTGPKDKALTPVGFSVQQFEINLAGGNDSVQVTLSGNYTSAKSFIVNLGPGNNEFQFLANGKSILSGGLRMDVTGGAGNDYLDLKFGTIQASVDITASLGGGVDGKLEANKIVGPSMITLEGIHSGAHINADIDLGTGSNQFRTFFNGNALGSFGGLTFVNFNFTGSNSSAQKDDVTVLLKNVNLDTGANIRFGAQLGAGNDAFHAQFSETFTFGNSLGTGANASLEFDVDGGAGNDLLEAIRTGTPQAFNIEGVVDFHFRGGLGNDVLKVDLGTNVAAAQLKTMSDTSIYRIVRVLLEGGAGHDTVGAAMANTAQGDFIYDLALFGGTGNDTLTFSGANNGGSVSFGAAAAVILDGGLGIDRASVQTSGGFPVKQYNRESTF